MKLIQKYGHLFRRLRVVHYLHNLNHRKELAYQKPLYKRAGLKKSVWSSISHRDFAKHPLPEPTPWLDQPNGMEQLKASDRYRKASAEEQKRLEKWVESGYMVLPGFADPAELDQISADVDRIIDQKLLPFHHTRTRVMNCIKHSTALRKLVFDEELTGLLGFLLGKEVLPFQTMNFLTGSKASPHSDSIHMTTEPLGYLIAIWIALEDIHPDSGPVAYCPGSHKLPYTLSDSFETGNSRWLVGQQYYDNYLENIREQIQENGLEEKPLIAKKGDLLIWHGNLIHGGTAVNNPELSRKSLVVHYFAKGVICYHELTQRPAIIEAF